MVAKWAWHNIQIYVLEAARVIIPILTGVIDAWVTYMTYTLQVAEVTRQSLIMVKDVFSHWTEVVESFVRVWIAAFKTMGYWMEKVFVNVFNFIGRNVIDKIVGLLNTFIRLIPRTLADKVPIVGDLSRAIRNAPKKYPDRRTSV